MTKIRSFFIKTYGCSHNISDSERMVSLFLNAGYNHANSEKSADLLIVNTCVVKIPTEQKILSYLREIEKLKKPIIVAGCMPQSNREKVSKELKNFSMIGTNTINKIVEVAEKALVGKRVVVISNEKEAYKSADFQNNPFVKIIPISSGCYESCTYCKTKFSRAHLKSRKIKDIVSEIKQFLKKGIYEFWLTSEDCVAYGQDLRVNILDLLKCVEKIKGNFKVRLGMANPKHIYLLRAQIADFFSHTQKFYKFLHIPVQSGNNNILKAMNRKYSVEEFSELIKILRLKNPDLTLSTDIICGFPGETNEQFLDSINLVKDLLFDVLNISRFWPMQGTLAAKMPNQINDIIKAKHSKLARTSFEKFALIRNKIWKNWTGKIFVDEKKARCVFVGRNYAYKPIVVYSKKNLLGKTINVKISEINPLFLKAQILN